jgi:hypothetical protein
MGYIDIFFALLRKLICAQPAQDGIVAAISYKKYGYIP